MSTSSASVDSQVILRLREYEQTGELAEVARWHRELLTIQMEARDCHAQACSELIAGKMPPELVLERASCGQPLLSFEELTLDWDRVRLLYRKVLCLVAMYFPERVDEVGFLESLLLSDSAFRGACNTWYEELSVSDWVGAGGGRADLLDFALWATLRPFLMSHAATLTSMLEVGSWRRSRCPVCGGKPDLSLLNEAGARELVCWRCDTRWVSQRLECPFCGNQSPDKLTYFMTDGGSHGVHVCQDCKGYMKGIDLRQMPSEVLIPLERIVTHDLDREAQANDYLPGNRTTHTGNSFWASDGSPA